MNESKLAVTAARLPRFAWSQETLLLIASLWFTLAGNGVFWQAALHGRDPASLATWRFLAGTGLLITALHFGLAALPAFRRSIKPLLVLLLALAASAGFYMQKFGIYVDPDMLRNVLRTDPAEARELLTLDLLPHLTLYLALPLLFLSRVDIRPRRLGKALLVRGLSLAAALVLGVAGLALAYQDLAALMRNQKEVRYLITPGNVVYSLARALSQDAQASPAVKKTIAPDAAPGAAWARRDKPVLFVLVVGETARAANWGPHPGPDGKLRDTTPETAAQDVIGFTDVSSCGTNTEVSLPCMFSLQGRRHYDEADIRGSESLLQVLARAGFRVIWRDNQSGCKGVCAGLELQRPEPRPALCDGERCLDEILLDGIPRLAADQHGNLVLVLHQLGNHGPAYYKRYPEAFRRFGPGCDTADLSQCSQAQIGNSYDNALLYTDHFLARTIDLLKAQEARYDTALLYVSDHGESLGENGLYLHGMPYAIAPREQTRVPMLMWFSRGYAKSFGLDTACLRREATKPASHDNLFHTLLGLLDVSTQARDPRLDLSAPCRS
ncbi:MAG: phosphoethanolamine--lipid A transferase [Azovibrio sp.]|uniref:phosphoethanolamine transferase n=1 Tax=Azovibrio sp. TaxID=1872673 RepID=UPI003C758EE6